VTTILEQLGLDQTFFVQLIIFAVLFFFLRNLYFKPFLRLFDLRHKRTVQDKEAAEKLYTNAQTKLDEYKRRLAEERLAARKDYEAIIAEAKKEEAEIYARARAEAKQITQEAIASVNQQRDQLKNQLEAEVETLAKKISESLLLRKV
jgi:F-type H+-transporting ATPase subunit b